MRTHNIPFSIIIKKITINYPKSAAMGFFQPVRNSDGKQATSILISEIRQQNALIVTGNMYNWQQGFH